MAIKSLPVVIAAGLILSGCTYFTAERVVGSDNKTEGIRIPDQKPLLIVTGGQVSTVMVPNPDRATAIRFGAFLAKHDVSLDFGNGVLSKVTSNQDSTTIVNSLIDLAKTVAQNAEKLAAAFSTQGSQFTTAFQIYEIMFDGSGSISQLKPLLSQNDAQLLFLPTTGSGGTQSGTPTSALNQGNGTSQSKQSSGKDSSKLPNPQ